jgi:large subunit ribosomal protein L25
MQLKASKREVLGKAVRRIRHAGKVPAVIYGQGHKPRALELDALEFDRVFVRAGHTQLVDLLVEGARAQKVLIKEVQLSPRKHVPVHVDFHQVSLREKIQVDVPVTFTGEAPGVKAGIGDLMPLVQTLKVECLPANIPEAIEIDVSGLAEADAGIHVSELQLPAGVTAVTEADELVVKIQPSRVSAEVPGEEAGAEAEGAEEAGGEEAASSEQ